MREERLAAGIVQPEGQELAAVANDEAADGRIILGSCGPCQLQSTTERSNPAVHRSLLVSISPNRSLLQPDLLDAADVAEAAEETEEKEVEGWLARG